MTPRLSRSRYRARLAETAADLARAQALRHRAFRGAGDGMDADRFDALCRHVLVERRSDGALMCCYRFMVLPDGSGIADSYSAQFYDLSSLSAYDRPMVELGRFCVVPGAGDPDILRVALARLGQIVEQAGAELLFGCSSFTGTEADPYEEAFALLSARHLAPARWLPRPKAPSIVRFAGTVRRRPDLRKALQAMPPLLRSYLALGGWVSDHAVVDRDMNTLHVFTGVEIASIPAGRARVLRGMGA